MVFKLEKITILLGLFLFFLMIFLPTSYRIQKSIFMILVTMCILFSWIKNNKLKLNKRILLWILLWIVSGLFFMLIGAFNSAPGALRVVTVNVVWPLVYLAYIEGISKKSILIKIIKVLFISNFVISIYTISYILYSYGVIPGFLYIPLNQGQSIGFYSGFMEYSLYNTTSLFFLVPFIITTLFIWPTELKNEFNKSFIYINFILGILLVILSGRRALQLIVLITPLIIFFLRLTELKKIKMKNIKIIIKISLLIFIIIIFSYFIINKIYEFEIISIYNNILDAFINNFYSNDSVRKSQFFALIKGLSHNPLFGAGEGASAPGSIRSNEMTWAYELSYVAKLYHRGIIGFSVYIGQIIWIIIMSIKIMKFDNELRFYIYPVIVGTVSFLIANATNPYLGKYDYLWVLFLPLAIINTWLIQKKKVNF